MRRSSHVRFFSVWMVDFFAVNFFREWLSPRAEDTSSVLCPFTAWHAVLKDEPSISQQHPTANSAHHVHLEPLLAVHAAENICSRAVVSDLTITISNAASMLSSCRWHRGGHGDDVEYGRSASAEPSDSSALLRFRHLLRRAIRTLAILRALTLVLLPAIILAAQAITVPAITVMLILAAIPLATLAIILSIALVLTPTITLTTGTLGLAIITAITGPLVLTPANTLVITPANTLVIIRAPILPIIRVICNIPDRPPSRSDSLDILRVLICRLRCTHHHPPPPLLLPPQPWHHSDNNNHHHHHHPYSTVHPRRSGLIL